MVRCFVAGVACMALVAACVGGKKAAMHAPAPNAQETNVAGGAPTMAETPQAEINRLSAEIDQKRTELHLQEPTPAAMPGPATPMSSVPSSTDPTCKPAKTDTCTQSCTFSDSICKNAQRICDLAQSMDGDTWAADKCSRAKQTCEAAHERCCSCQ